MGKSTYTCVRAANSTVGDDFEDSTAISDGERFRLEWIKHMWCAGCRRPAQHEIDGAGAPRSKCFLPFFQHVCNALLCATLNGSRGRKWRGSGKIAGRAAIEIFSAVIAFMYKMRCCALRGKRIQWAKTARPRARARARLPCSLTLFLTLKLRGAIQMEFDGNERRRLAIKTCGNS